MRAHHKRSILSTLFLPYTVLFTVSFFIIIAFFTISEARKIRKNSFASIENNVISTMDSFDQMIDSLDSISQNVLYSNLVKDHFTKYVENLKQPSSITSYSNNKNTKALYDVLIALLGPNPPVSQLYIYDLDRGCFGVGLDNTPSIDRACDYSWYQKVMLNNGEKYVFLDHDKRLFPYYSYDEGRYFLTLIREYYSAHHNPQGIIEVKKSIAPLMDIIKSYNKSYHEKFYIIGPEGETIYPITKDSNKISEYSKIIKNSNHKKLLETCSFIDTDGEYIIYQSSEYSGFTVAAVVSSTSLMTPIRQYIGSTLILLLGAYIAIILVSYMISQRISKPLGHIYSCISTFQVNSDQLTNATLPEINTSVLELNGLYQALIRMQSQARLALDHELELQNREMQSRMLALQAQMNPHFLNNSLATIQAMAEEGMSDEICLMCQNISSILRYISSDSQQLVPLSEELKHTREYLDCMKIRYNNQLTYQITIPAEMQECNIPKLCLQLIVENAIKFSTQKRGPWNILITAQLTKQYWEIQIKDNGPGFTKGDLDLLQEKIRAIDETNVLPNLEINGMGLMNIYIRFKLLYRGQHIFRLSNNLTEGACVTIGGVLE